MNGALGYALGKGNVKRFGPCLLYTSIGGISDLMDWARAIQARDPAFTDFSQQVQRLARLGDLAAIGKLCERMPVA